MLFNLGSASHLCGVHGPKTQADICGLADRSHDVGDNKDQCLVSKMVLKHKCFVTQKRLFGENKSLGQRERQASKTERSQFKKGEQRSIYLERPRRDIFRSRTASEHHSRSHSLNAIKMTAPTPQPLGPHSAFFYGTLMAPQVLSRVCHGSHPSHNLSAFTVQPALLHAHRRHRVKGADYPAILPTSNSSDSVRGTFVTGLTDGDLWRLDIFEGSEYERRKVRCTLIDDGDG